MNNYKKNGTALMQSAMVLCISIIFVFFFLVCPLWNSVRKKQAIAAYRTAQATLLQANKMYALANDNAGIYDVTLPVDRFAEKYYHPYLSVAKVCTGIQNGCWNKAQYKDLKNKSHFNKITYSMILSDRTVIGFYKNQHGFLSAIIDINGPAGVNKLGRDVFVFYYYNSLLTPKVCEAKYYKHKFIQNGLHLGGYDKCGLPHDRYDYKELHSKDMYDGCNKKAVSDENGIGSGAACGAVISQSGWVMDKIYPW